MSYGCVLFYAYVEVADAGALRAEQERLCVVLGLRGRVRVAREGVNGTLSGVPTALDAYQALTAAQLQRLAARGGDARELLQIANIDWKRESALADGVLQEHAFARLSVRECAEIVALGIDPRALPAALAAPSLPPTAFLALLQRLRRERRRVALVDCRNRYEWIYGRFEGALCPDTRAFSEFPRWLARARPQLEQADAVLMYCTGGVRCERASALVQRELSVSDRGGVVVRTLAGGVVRFLETFRDALELPAGSWAGGLVMFDGRRLVRHRAVERDAFRAVCELCAARVRLDELRSLHSERDRCDYCRARMLLCRECSLEGGADSAVKDATAACIARGNVLCADCDTAARYGTLKKPQLLRLALERRADLNELTLARKMDGIHC